MISIFEKRRTWVYKEFNKRGGTALSNSKKSQLMKILWKYAKRKYK